MSRGDQEAPHAVVGARPHHRHVGERAHPDPPLDPVQPPAAVDRRGGRLHAAAGSLPASGSVSAKQPTASPAAIRGSQASFWASEPKRWIAVIASEPWTETKVRRPGVAGFELLAGEAVVDRAAAGAPVALEVHAEHAQLAQLGDELARPVRRLEPALGLGQEALAHPGADAVAPGPLARLRAAARCPAGRAGPSGVATQARGLSRVGYSIVRMTTAGAPTAIEKGGQVVRHDGVGADHAALADRHATGDHHVGPAPHVVADARRALGREALPGHRAIRVGEAVVGVGDEAAVGQHAVLAELDELERRDLDAEVQEAAAADPDPPRRHRGQPDARLEQHVRADLEPPLAQHLQHVAVHRPAAERAAAGELRVDADAVPGQRVALVPAPLLQPQLEVRGIHRRRQYARASAVAGCRNRARIRAGARVLG